MENKRTTDNWLLTTEQVAEITQKSTDAVRWAIRRGHLAASKPKTGPYLISRAAVADWLGLQVEDIRSRCSTNTPGGDEAAA
jgi:excisionase family DNA binding protein